MATGKSYQPYLLTNSAYEADLFDGNTLNTPDIVDMLDTFHGPFPTYSEKEFTNNSVFNDPLYGIFDNSPMLSNTIQTNGFNQMPGNITVSSTNNLNNINNIIRYSPDNIENYCYERKSYSPLLESSEINLENMSSPEMAPVSPNRVCPQSEYTYQYDSSNGSNTSNANNNNNNNNTNSNNPNSSNSSTNNNNNNNINNNNNNNATYQILENVVPLKSEYDQVTTIVDFLTDGTQPSSHGSTETIITLTSNGSPITVQNINTNNNTNNTNNNTNTNNNFYQQICSPHSPSSISSNYSLDSTNSQHKTFATLDSVQCNIKQEPMDTILQYQPVVPTVVDETIVSSGAFIPATICQTAPAPPPQQQQQQPTQTQTTNQVIYNITSNSGVNNGTTTTSYYYMQPTSTNTVPATELVNSHLISTSTNTLIHHNVNSNSSSSTSTNATTPTGSKKRSASGFGPLPGVIGGGQKKQRMSKREKQKLMESYIEKYEKENKDLNNQIKLFEKQIEFCKKYLSENVAPYIQRQQQQQQPIHHTLQSFVGLA